VPVGTGARGGVDGVEDLTSTRTKIKYSISSSKKPGAVGKVPQASRMKR
jgi:hypothetical protein